MAGRRHYRRKMAARAAGNACRRCGKRPPAPGRKNCHECGEHLRAAARERYHAGKEAGMKYGDRSAESRRRSARIRSERKRLAWVESGMCSRCGKTGLPKGGPHAPPAGPGARSVTGRNTPKDGPRGAVSGVDPPRPSTARRSAFPVPHSRRTAVARSERMQRRDGATWRGAGRAAVPIAEPPAMEH